MDEHLLKDAIDHAAHILKTAQPGSLPDAAVQAHDLLYNALITHYAKQSPHIHALPLPAA